ncbi:MAG: hypothetical protein ACRDK3_15935 [Actinomycetota bacterium]
MAVGWAIIAYGIAGLLDNAGRTNPGQWIRWFAGALIVHDFIVAPLTFAVGAQLVARLRRPLRAPVQGALIASGIIVLTTWPFLRGYGLRADNPSALPNHYAAGLTLVLTLVWLVAAMVAAKAWRQPR